MLTIKRTFLTMILNMVMMTAIAAGLPASYPGKFGVVGTIDRIDYMAREVVVSDTLALAHKDIVVHTRHSTGGITRLRKGVKIGVDFVVTDTGQRTITEAWVLPDAYKQPEEDE